MNPDVTGTTVLVCGSPLAAAGAEPNEGVPTALSVCAWLATAWKSATELVQRLVGEVCSYIRTSWSSFGEGSRPNTVVTTLKIAVVEPIPSPSTRIAGIV